MRIGYARVSTEDQNLDLQRRALRDAGCTRIFEEKISGAVRGRPALGEALRSLEGGDILVVWKLDRLGRSLRHLIEIVEDLESRAVGFQSLSDHIDTTSTGGRLLFHIMGAIAEFERAQISERTKAGLDAARRNGRRLGRPRTLSDQQIADARALAQRDRLSLSDIADTLNVRRTTLWRALSVDSS